jgi:hypothetical protein
VLREMERTRGVRAKALVSRKQHGRGGDIPDEILIAVPVSEIAKGCSAVEREDMDQGWAVIQPSSAHPHTCTHQRALLHNGLGCSFQTAKTESITARSCRPRWQESEHVQSPVVNVWLARPSPGHLSRTIIPWQGDTH